MVCVACGAPQKPLQIRTIAEEVDRPPLVAVLPAPKPITEAFPTEWKVVNTPGGTFFALSETQYNSLVLWLEDATRYVTAVKDQLDYYRSGLTSSAEEGGAE